LGVGLGVGFSVGLGGGAWLCAPVEPALDAEPLPPAVVEWPADVTCEVEPDPIAVATCGVGVAVGWDDEPDSTASEG